MRKHIGKCIYCGGSDSKLTDEHIIPYGLLLEGQEELVLEKASCVSCQEIINKVETNVLKVLLKQPRSVLGFRSRHKTHKNEHVAKIDNKEVQVKMGEIGAWITLPEFNKPHLGTKEQEGIDVIGTSLIVYNHEVFTEKMKKKEISSISMTFKYEPAYFARFIAKIAHGFFVYKFGLDRLKDLYLPGIILGKDSDLGARIGCIQTEKLEEKTIVRIDVHIKNKSKDAVGYVRFFEPWGGFTYVAHIGVANQP